MEPKIPLKNTEIVIEQQQKTNSDKPISNYNELGKFIKSGKGRVENTPEENFNEVCNGLKDFIEYEKTLYY